MRLTHLELAVRTEIPEHCRKAQWGPLMSLFNTEMLGRLGREEGAVSGPTSHRSPPGGPSERPDGCLRHALPEAATRGQALASHQDHRNHLGPGVQGQEPELRLTAREGPEKGAGSWEEPDIWT